MTPYDLARWLVIVTSNRLIPHKWTKEKGWCNAGVGGYTHGGSEFATPAVDTAAKVGRLASVVWP